MPDIIRTGLFLLTGIVCWSLSLRFGLAIYGRQPISWPQVFWGVIETLNVNAYFAFVAPILFKVLGHTKPMFSPIRTFFDQSHPFVQIAVFIIVTDFLAYWVHRMLHSGMLWRLHQFHHSAKKLNWVSGLRASTLNQFLIEVPYTFAAFLILFTRGKTLSLFFFIKANFFQNFLHSSIRLPYTKTIEKFFVTPRVHFVHHHPNPVFTNSNYGFLFSSWDKLFGTYTCPDSLPKEEQGLVGLDYETPDWKMFLCFKRPAVSSAPPAHEQSKAS